MSQVRPRIEDHLPLVRAIASRVARKLPPSIEYDDLVQEGTLGLMQAAARYNPQANDNFALYAQRRIQGAMFDSVRRRHWVAAIAAPIEDAEHLAAPGDLEAETGAREIADQVQTTCQELTSLKRRAIHLVYAQALSRKRAASAMGLEAEIFDAAHQGALEILRAKLRHLRPAA